MRIRIPPVLIIGIAVALTPLTIELQGRSHASLVPAHKLKPDAIAYMDDPATTFGTPDAIAYKDLRPQDKRESIRLTVALKKLASDLKLIPAIQVRHEALKQASLRHIGTLTRGNLHDVSTLAGERFDDFASALSETPLTTEAAVIAFTEVPMDYADDTTQFAGVEE